MTPHDPLQETIARLPDGGPDAALSRRVAAAALGAFEAESARFARFDRWMLGRIAPAVLSLCVLASAFDLVRYFVRVFGPAASVGAPSGAQSGASSGAVTSRSSAQAARVCGRTAIVGCASSRRWARAEAPSGTRRFVTQARPLRPPPS